MLPIKNILYPTDFSEPSYDAMKVPNELALHFSAEMCAVHIISPVSMVEPPTDPATYNVFSYRQEMETSAKNSL